MLSISQKFSKTNVVLGTSADSLISPLFRLLRLPRQKPKPKLHLPWQTTSSARTLKEETETTGYASVADLKSFNVVFDPIVEIENIEVDGYGTRPKAHRRDPNRPYKLVDMAHFKDEQTRMESSLGSARARARGIIMDRVGDYKDVREVRIIVGPKFDIKITLDDDGPDLLQFNEEPIKHSGEKFERKDDVMRITMPILERDRRFILDSGSGHDLISEKRAERMNLEMEQYFSYCQW